MARTTRYIGHSGRVMIVDSDQRFAPSRDFPDTCHNCGELREDHDGTHCPNYRKDNK